MYLFENFRFKMLVAEISVTSCQIKTNFFENFKCREAKFQALRASSQLYFEMCNFQNLLSET